MDQDNLLFDGLHSDNDPNAQPPNTYRDSMNGDIVAIGPNRYAFEALMGNTISFTIPDHYQSKPFQPIGWCSFVNEMIVFLANDQSESNQPGEIAKVTLNNNGTGASYTPLYYHAGLRFTKEHPIPHDGIVGKPENANIKRVVWTDNYNSLRSINWVDPRFTTYIASGSLVVGKKYMVLTTDATSYITHNTFDWAPGRAGDGTSQNVFTAAGTTYTTTGTPLVIEYVPLEALSVISDFAPGTIEYQGWTAGHLLCGNYQYFYQLETQDGSRTSYSYLSLPIQNISDSAPGDNTLSYSHFLNRLVTVDSLKALKLAISGIDNTTYTKIRVGFIRATADGVYDDPEIFIYNSLTSSTYEFTHFGNETTLEVLSLDDLTTPAVALDLVKTISSTKNILFAGNIGLAPDPEIDFSGVKCKTIQYLLPSDLGDTVSTLGVAQPQSITGGFSIYGHNRLKSEDNTSLNVSAHPYQWFEVIGTAGGGANKCTYNGTDYSAGQFFQTVPTVKFITNVGDCKAVPVIRIQKYTSATTLGSGNYRNIRFGDDFADFKGMAVSHYLKSHWRRETYRYGIFFYGRKGQQNFVQWLIDKKIPEQWKGSADTEVIDNSGTTAAIGFNMRLSELNTAGDWQNNSLRSIGLSFSGLDFNEVASAYSVALADLHTVVKGFSIVRVELDAQIHTQGVVYPVMGLASNAHILAFDKLTSDNYYDGTDNNLGRRPNCYMYYSPDNFATANNHNIASGDYMEVTDQYDPYDTTNDGFFEGSNNNYYNKFYSQRSGTVGSGIYNKSGIANLNANNLSYISPGALGLAVGSLSSFNNTAISNASIFGSTKTAYGSEGLYFETTDDENATYPLGIGSFGAGSQWRTIVNWIRPKNNLYGGTDASVKATHKYLFAGHYQALDTAFMTYMTGTSDATPSAPLQTKLAGIVNNVEVFGDCYVCNVGWARESVDEGSVSNSFSSATIIPMESRVNANWIGTAGATYNSVRNFNTDPTQPNGIARGILETFNWEPVYTQNEQQYFFNARPLDMQGVNRDEHLIQYSLEKVDGEISDSWKKWLVNNFKRVDGQYGPINNLRAKASKLFYWQSRGVGCLPVYERQLQDSALGGAIQLGVGGILDRFDEIDYSYGNQHQMSLMENEDTFIWFDFRRKTVMRLSMVGGKNPLSYIKGLDNFFYTKFTEVEGQTGSTIFNSDSPFLGRGIVSYYDHRFKRGMMFFKYSKRLGGEGSRVNEKDFVVFFNHGLDKFTGIGSFTTNHIISHNGHLLMVREVRPSINVGAYVIGDEVTDTTNYHNYICTADFTSVGTEPSADPTHWTKTTQINQVYVSWRGDNCNFFKKIHEFYLTVVVPSVDGSAITVDNVKVSGNNIPFTDVYTSNENQTAQDINIVSTNKNYWYVDGAWFFNLPLDSRGARLSDSWIQIKMRVKNYTTNPMTGVNNIKRIFRIKSSIRRKL